MGFRLFVLPKKMFKTTVFDALGARGIVALGETTRRLPVLPPIAPPRCFAMRRRPTWTRPWYVRVLDAIGS